MAVSRIRARRSEILIWALAVPLMFAHRFPAAAQEGEARVVQVTAHVLDVGSRTAITGAVIELSGVANRYVTDDVGRASFDAVLGEYVLTARAAGYRTLQGDFSVMRPGSFVLHMMQADLEDPGAPSRLLVSVFDSETGRAIEGAVVSLPSGGRVATDARGRAGFSNPGSRLTRVTVEMIGYARRTEPVSLHPGQTTALEVAMTVEAVPLRPITVEVRSRFLELHGVYRRMDQGILTRMVTREMIERQGSPRISDVFSHVPGLRVRRQGSSVGGAAFRSVLYAPRNCPLSIFVDGVEWNPDWEGSVDIDSIPPEWVEIAEIYWGLQTPPEYSFRGKNGCGAVLIWTKNRSGYGSQ